MRLPDVTFKCRVAGEWVNKTTEQFFKGKRVVLFASTWCLYTNVFK